MYYIFFVLYKCTIYFFFLFFGGFVAPVHPSSVDKRTLHEQTALLLAVSCEHVSCVRCLLEAGADTDISSKNKETPLYKGTAVKPIVNSKTIKKKNKYAYHHVAAQILNGSPPVSCLSV